MGELNIQGEMIERLIYLDRAIKKTRTNAKGEGEITFEAIRNENDLVFEEMVKYRIIQKVARHKKIITSLYDRLYNKIINQEI